MTMVMKFWKVMNTLLNTILVRVRKAPRTISIGCAAEMTKAGNQPASPPTIRTKPARPAIQPGCNRTCGSILVWSRSLA